MKKRIITLTLALLLFVSMFPITALAADEITGSEDSPYLSHATRLRGQNNTTHDFYIVGSTGIGVWGTNVYTDDSHIRIAAVHAGIVAVGEGKVVTIRILPGLSSYEGTTRNGITSRSYGSYGGSYEFVTDSTPTPQPPPDPTPEPTPEPTPPDPTPEPADPNTSTQTTGLTAETGVKLSWSPIENALYYRVYRSTVQGEEGISITDFAITGTDYVDVNVNASTTYYYTVRAVFKEATTTGDPEELGAASDPVTVTTGETILGGNASDMPEGVKKNIILMQIDNPNMSVNGVLQEVDPGMGTSPLLRNGRTLVPIRAIIEAMGGEVDYDFSTSNRIVTLDCSDYFVEMYIDRKDFKVNGVDKEMDVAPQIIGNRTMVPLRFAAENVGCVVEWINSTREIVIVFYTGGQPPADILI